MGMGDPQIIDVWEYILDEKGMIKELEIHNHLRETGKRFPEHHYDSQCDYNFTKDVANLFELTMEPKKITTRPATIESIRAGLVDISIQMKDVDPYSQVIETSMVDYTGGMLVNPRSYEIKVKKKEIVTNHTLVWLIGDVDGTHILFDIDNNQGIFYCPTNPKAEYYQFDLVHRFDFSHYGRTKFYHFTDGMEDDTPYPILLTSEGILCECDAFKLHRTCKRDGNRVKVINYMV